MVSDRKVSSLTLRYARGVGMVSSNDSPSSMPPDQPPAASGLSASSAPQSLRVIPADDLFGEEKEVLIQNGADLYRLRRTRNGKLILCK